VIIVRSPLRMSFGVGGTDLPSYYRKHAGFVVAAAITRYVYVTISEAFWRKSVSNIRNSRKWRPSTKSSIPSSAKP